MIGHGTGRGGLPASRSYRVAASAYTSPVTVGAAIANASGGA